MPSQKNEAYIVQRDSSAPGFPELGASWYSHRISFRSLGGTGDRHCWSIELQCQPRNYPVDICSRNSPLLDFRVVRHGLPAVTRRHGWFLDPLVERLWTLGIRIVWVEGVWHWGQEIDMFPMSTMERVGGNIVSRSGSPGDNLSRFGQRKVLQATYCPS